VDIHIVPDTYRKWLSTWQTDQVTSTSDPPPDRHKVPGILVRPDPEVTRDGREKLDAAGWTMTEFVSACLVLVGRNPGAMLDRLAEYRPPRRRGRPKKA